MSFQKPENEGNGQPREQSAPDNSDNSPDNSKAGRLSKSASSALQQVKKPLSKAFSFQSSKPKQPPGGFDPTPIPPAPLGYNVKITFHRATNLPIADLATLSSDPFILAQLNTGLPTRHKEDPFLRLRTFTVRHSTDPVWNCEWIVANVPATGFKLKARIYDEDPADHDDRLGNAHVVVGNIDENWEGIKEGSYKVRKRMGSKRAYAIRAVSVCFNKTKHMNGRLYISVEVLGRTEGNEGEGGRAYTLGPCWWTKHYSPLLGRIANRKEPDEDEKKAEKEKTTGKTKPGRYNFQANQFQLQGPVPAEMYHRYVEFKPFVKGMFTAKGIRGFLFNKVLHHQHARVYNFDRSTEYGVFERPSKDMTLKFLELVHFDQGGRIFTYVLSLDALFRFTETGKEFGIDMLSKHTMHSDVNVYIAFSGEFFIRRLKHSTHHKSTDEERDHHTHPPDDISGGPPAHEPPRDPAHYELIIDNDSGTYRPNAKLLPQLKEFMEHNFPGLKVVTLDSQGDAEKMNRMKEEQRELKEKEGDRIIYRQVSHGSSISSSDEEELDAMEAQGGVKERGLLGRMQKDFAAKQQAKMEHWKGFAPGRSESRRGHTDINTMTDGQPSSSS